MATVNKTTYAGQIQTTAAAIAAAIDRATDLRSIYFDRGYNSGGANVIIDGDVSELGITADAITNFITLAEQLQNFADNQTVTSGDYDATLNMLRTDA